ncbi:MAG: outer membrane protein assembly factor BamB [Methylotenera sp.]|nr:outer membrane protein assembly factor BamB [Methylotenera sp.]
MFSPLSKKTTCLLALSLLLLSACSVIGDVKDNLTDTLFGRVPADAPDPLVDFKEIYASKLLWQAKLGPAQDFDFVPVVDAGFVYAASSNGEIVKLDAVSGKQEWRVNAGEVLSGGVGVGGSLVLVGTQKGLVYAYDIAGKFLWKAKLSSEVLSAPKYFDGLVIARSGDNHIYGLNANDGTRKWVYDRTGPALTLRSSVGVVVDGGAVYAGFGGGKLVALRADNGKMLWEASVAQPKGVTEIERIADITSSPVVEGPLVYAVAYQGKIAAVDRMSGRIVWNRDISSLTGLSMEDGRIYLAHAAGAVYALDYTTGKSFWRQAVLKNRKLSVPLTMGSLLAVGDLEGYVHFLSRDDGVMASRIQIGSSAVMPRMALLNSNSLVVQARDGGLYAIQVK